VVAFVLIVTGELSSAYYGQKNLFVNKKKLRSASLAFSILFIITGAIRIYAILTSS
jgi:hypothetical protein